MHLGRCKPPLYILYRRGLTELHYLGVEALRRPDNRISSKDPRLFLYPYVKQTELIDCGHCALLHISNHFSLQVLAGGVCIHISLWATIERRITPPPNFLTSTILSFIHIYKTIQKDENNQVSFPWSLHGRIHRLHRFLM